MSLLHRWSLPSRSFTRDRSQDGEPTDQSKYPTIHISQLGSRRRANLSSVFSTLFEKPENRQSIRNADDRGEVADDLPLLASRRENVRPDTESRYSHDHECPDIMTPVETVPLRKYSMSEPKSKSAATIGNTASLPRFASGVFDQVTRQVDGKPKARTFSLSSTETHEKDNRSESFPLKSVETTDHCDRSGSASSFYPSEGIRSPVSGYFSPQLAPTCSIDYFAEYRRFGRYSSHSSWYLSSAHMNETLASDAIVEKVQDALVTGDAAPNSVITGQNCNFGAPSFVSLPRDRMDVACSNENHLRHTSSILHRVEPQQKPSSNSEITVPILENEDATSSQLEVSFMSYKRQEARNTTEDDDNGHEPKGRNASSVDRLHLGVDTDRTIRTATGRSSTSDEEGAWSSIHEVRERPLSRATSWAQLLTLSSSNGSSNTLAQSLQKLKLKRWAKRVCFKTKARFELVRRPVTTVKVTRSKVRRRKWRRKMKKTALSRIKKVKKSLGTTKRKGKNRWNLGETLEVTKKRMMQHKEIADHFFNTLGKRKSLQFGLFRSEKEDKIVDTHKRVRSCPANMGL
ncbi:hypothetical protein F5Y09DRAFT_333949 [Xylaria sp. FL1042]|nr:hypothetical protein F5Y09DRAFT_333949 [Xylaria sp. FL1042]